MKIRQGAFLNAILVQAAAQNTRVRRMQALRREVGVAMEPSGGKFFPNQAQQASSFQPFRLTPSGLTGSRKKQ